MLFLTGDYLIGYKYLDEDRILQALAKRPKEQSVVVTGQGGAKLKELADAASEVKDIKHVHNDGVKARKAWIIDV